MSPETTPPGWSDHVAIDGDEVAQQPAVDVGGALHHEQVAGHVSLEPMLKSPMRAAPPVR